MTRDCKKPLIPAEQRPCFNCGKTGHRAGECPEPDRRKAAMTVSPAEAEVYLGIIECETERRNTMPPPIPLSAFTVRGTGSQRERRQAGFGRPSLFSVLNGEKFGGTCGDSTCGDSDCQRSGTPAASAATASKPQPDSRTYNTTLENLPISDKPNAETLNRARISTSTTKMIRAASPICNITNTSPAHFAQGEILENSSIMKGQVLMGQGGNSIDGQRLVKFVDDFPDLSSVVASKRDRGSQKLAIGGVRDRRIGSLEHGGDHQAAIGGVGGIHNGTTFGYVHDGSCNSQRSGRTASTTQNDDFSTLRRTAMAPDFMTAITTTHDKTTTDVTLRTTTSCVKDDFSSENI